MATGTRKGSQLFTSSGVLGVQAQAKTIYALNIVASGATVPLAIVKTGGSGGTAQIQESGIASGSRTFPYGEGFTLAASAAGVYVTVDGNTTSILVSYDEYA